MCFISWVCLSPILLFCAGATGPYNPPDAEQRSLDRAMRMDFEAQADRGAINRTPTVGTPTVSQKRRPWVSQVSRQLNRDVTSIQDVLTNRQC
jgi:hypothetical protein